VPHAAIAVLTEKDLPTIVAQKGSQAWVLNPKQALKHRYLVCTRNQTRRNPDAPEPHKSAFLVGVIEDLEPLPAGEGPQRYRIRLSDYARVNIPNVWGEWRNPVRYTTLEALGIDPATLRFGPLGAPPDTASATTMAPSRSPEGGLTIAQAKEGLARTFGVSPDAIEIVIRG
jgi:hypothetical protein